MTVHIITINDVNLSMENAQANDVFSFSSESFPSNEITTVSLPTISMSCEWRYGDGETDLGIGEYYVDDLESLDPFAPIRHVGSVLIANTVLASPISEITFTGIEFKSDADVAAFVLNCNVTEINFVRCKFIGYEKIFDVGEYILGSVSFTDCLLDETDIVDSDVSVQGTITFQNCFLRSIETNKALLIRSSGVVIEDSIVKLPTSVYASNLSASDSSFAGTLAYSNCAATITDCDFSATASINAIQSSSTITGSSFTTSAPLVFHGAVDISDSTFLNVDPTSDAIQVDSSEITIDSCVFTNAPPSSAQDVYAINITDSPSVSDMTATITNNEFVDCPETYIYPANRTVDTTGNVYRTTSTTPLDAPTNLTATNYGFHQVSVSWSAVTDAVGYSVQYKGALDDSYLEVVVTTNSATLDGLRYGELYTIRVKALGDNTSYYDSAYATTELTTSAPIQLKTPVFQAITAIEDQITITWLPVVDDHLASYAVAIVAENAELEPTDTVQLVSGATSYSYKFEGLQENTAYRIGVKSVADGFPYVDSDYNALTIMTGDVHLTKLDEPSWLKVSLQSETHALVGYASVTNATSYSLEYKLVEDDEWTVISRQGNSWQILNNLTPKKDYVFRVKAVGNGTTYLDSDYVYAYESTVWNRPLAVPEISVEPHARRAIVSWSAIEHAVGYVIAYKLSTAENFTTQLLGEEVYSYEMKNLTTNATYVVKVKAKGDDDELYVDSDYCESVTFIAKEPTPKLNTPVIDEIASTASTITLQWLDDSRRVKNIVEYKQSSASNWSSPIEIDDDELTIKDLWQTTSYDFRVKSLGDGTSVDDSDYSSVETYSTKERVALAKPTITTTADGDSVTVTVSSSDASLVTLWVFEHAVETNGTLGTWECVYKISNYDTATFSNLTLGTRHAFRVYSQPKSTGEYNNSPYSEIAYATLARTLDAPTPTVSSVSATTIEIAWDAVFGATGYEVYLDGTKIAETLETSYIFTSLTADTNYSVQLKAIGDGTLTTTSALSTALTASTNEIVALSPPSINGYPYGSNGILIEWTYPNNATSVEIRVYDSSTFENQVARVEYGSGSETNEYVFSNLKVGKTYYIRGRAKGDGVNYSNSSYDYITVDTTENPLDVPIITLSVSRWHIVASIEVPSNASGYVFEYQKDGDADWIDITDEGATFEFDADEYCQYNFQAKAFGDGDAYNDSDWYFDSIQTEDIQPLDAPTLTGSVIDANSLSVSWTTSEYADGVLLQIATTSDFATPLQSLELDSSISSQTFNNLTGHTTYYLRAKELAPDSGDYFDSPYSTVLSLTTEKDKLATPTLTIQSYGRTSAVFKWSTVSDADSYAIFITTTARQSIPYSFVGTNISLAKVSYTRKELTPDTTYYVGFRAKANDDSDYVNSDWSSVQTFTTLALIPLDEITSFVATPSDHSIVMSWTLVEAASGYKIGYKRSSDEEYEYVEGMPPYELDELDAGTTYDITIQALGDGETYGDSSLYETSVTTTNPIELEKPTVKWIKGLNGAIHYAFELPEHASGYEAKLFDSNDEQVFTALDLTPFADSTIKRDINELQNGASYILKLKSVGDGVNYRDSQWYASDAVEVRDTTVVSLEQADAPQLGVLTASLQGSSGKVEFHWTNINASSPGVYIALYRGETLVASYSEYDSNVSSGLFTGLTLDAEYTVKIKAYGDGVQTRDSETVAYESFTIESQTTPGGGRTDKSQWPDDLQGYSIGKDGRLIVSFDKGTTWHELTTTRDSTVNFATSPVDSSCRRSGVYKENLPIRNELSVSVELLLDLNDPVIVELERRSKLNIAMRVGAFTDSGNGPVFTGFFSDASRSEELENVVRISGTFNLVRFIEWRASLWNADGTLDSTHPANTL